MLKKASLLLSLFCLVISCSSDTTEVTPENDSTYQDILNPILTINLNDLPNYANQTIPDYITKDNTNGNNITDIGATLGRVLFYDKNLSIDNSIACASCHKQEIAFTDNGRFSEGINGFTSRTSMRLVNNRFSNEFKYFWDERAINLEEQSILPIQDHIEMGFTGQDGNPGFSDLISKLQDIEYYKVLFKNAFGDEEVTKERVQLSLSQFVRSIQSFDSKYDQGRALVQSDGVDFPNFTTSENKGKDLFIRHTQFNMQGERVGGGVACAICHQPPEFDIVPDSKNNGVLFVEDENSAFDLTNTKSPSLRDFVDTNGNINGGVAMHNGDFSTVNEVLDHYNEIPNTFQGHVLGSIDQRLKPFNRPQKLNLTTQERQHLIAFLKTLTGQEVYTNEKWSNPFKD
jgi:cytochrome c peroxidase